MIKVGVIGATGYAGEELVRILARHPQVELVALTSQSYAGKPMAEVYPSLTGYVNLNCEDQDVSGVVGRSEVVMVALPHGHSAPVAREVAARGKKMVDLGADFRFDLADTYQKWYSHEHEAADLLAQAVYGLPELHRRRIREAWLVANPGCYPTGAILALAPALAEGIIDPASIIIDAKSGVSGAGRGLALGSLYAEVNESVHPYSVGRHRHTPEIEQELTRLAGRDVVVSFTPHLMPMTRGILSTVYATLTVPLSPEQVREAYRRFYRDEDFVRLLPEGQWPHTKWVYGSNHCHLNLTVDGRTGRLVVVSAIDNLVKGAAGQAVQNMNLLFGLPENLGLDYPGLCP
ncbi:N-acetyl-gamma-glutamyl-phosphate reductase [Clostridiales bacterium PH28_bin88]|nr:N-acetyl-gamma-glutamyl-phosphate reductase [Clostridiales bacterium PH28_bin88]